MYVQRGSSGQLAPGQFERIAKALADPRRFTLFQRIAEAEDDFCPYQSLCREFPITKGTISHHIKELDSAGLVESVRHGQYVHTRAVAGVIEAYAAELMKRVGGTPGGAAAEAAAGELETGGRGSPVRRAETSGADES
ncbi:MAG: ArsR/SmtB family transcription factor [Longimicrobiales bacterium]